MDAQAESIVVAEVVDIADEAEVQEVGLLAVGQEEADRAADLELPGFGRVVGSKTLFEVQEESGPVGTDWEFELEMAEQVDLVEQQLGQGE